MWCSPSCPSSCPSLSHIHEAANKQREEEGRLHWSPWPHMLSSLNLCKGFGLIVQISHLKKRKAGTKNVVPENVMILKLSGWNFPAERVTFWGGKENKSPGFQWLIYLSALFSCRFTYFEWRANNECAVHSQVWIIMACFLLKFCKSPKQWRKMHVLYSTVSFLF